MDHSAPSAFSAVQGSEDLTGRVALVTGAARGIGLEVARALAARGAQVGLLDVDAAALQAAAESVGQGLPLTTDIRQPDAVRQAVDELTDACGGLHILVNNAGICPMTDFAAIEADEWDRVLAINLKGAFLCCQAAEAHLRQAGSTGRVINLTSVAGQMGGVSVGAHYAASKGGLIALTKSLAQRLAPDGVTVNCVAPGTTATDLTANWTDADLKRAQSKIPLGRLAQPSEIAETVCFLASDRAAFITGATLDVNGGLYLR